MARRRQRVEDGPRVSSYQPTASPTRPPTSHLYFSNGDGNLLTFGFTQDEYAHAAIRQLFGESDYAWRKDEVGRVTLEADGLRVRECLGHLERIVETEPADDLPEYMVRQIEAFKSGIRPVLKAPDGSDLKPAEPKEKRKRAAPGEKVEKIKKEKPAGMKGVPELAADLQREGGEIRVILRKHVEKPGIGWLWSNDDYLKVRAVVKKELG